MSSKGVLTTIIVTIPCCALVLPMACGGLACRLFAAPAFTSYLPITWSEGDPKGSPVHLIPKGRAAKQHCSCCDGRNETLPRSHAGPHVLGQSNPPCVAPPRPQGAHVHSQRHLMRLTAAGRKLFSVSPADGCSNEVPVQSHWRGWRLAPAIRL